MAHSRRTAAWRPVCFQNWSRARCTKSMGAAGQRRATTQAGRPWFLDDLETRGKAAGSDRRRQQHFGGIMNTKRAIATMIGPALSAFLGTWHELEAGGPAGPAPSEQARPVDREAWARRLAGLNEADWRMAFAIGSRAGGPAGRRGLRDPQGELAEDQQCRRAAAAPQGLGLRHAPSAASWRSSAAPGWARPGDARPIAGGAEVGDRLSGGHRTPGLRRGLFGVPGVVSSQPR